MFTMMNISEFEMASWSKTEISEVIDNAIAIMGLEALKNEQREAFKSFIERQDVFQRAIESTTGT
jgi:hypothetical protein